MYRTKCSTDEKILNRVGFAGTEKTEKHDHDLVKHKCKEQEEQECNLPTRYTRHFAGLQESLDDCLINF